MTEEPQKSGARPANALSDWLPANILSAQPPFVTRDRVLDLLKLHNVNVSDREFAHWVNIGLLPKAERRRHDGAMHGFYPEVVWKAAREVRVLRDLGLSIDDIRPRVRDRFIDAAAEYANLPFEEKVDILVDRSASDYGGGLPPYLANAFEEFSRTRQRITGDATQRIEVTFIGESGRKTAYTLDREASGSYIATPSLSRRKSKS